MLHEKFMSEGVRRAVVMLMADDLRQELGTFSFDYEVKVSEYGSYPCVKVIGDKHDMITSSAIESCLDVINCYRLRYDGIGYFFVIEATGDGDVKKYTPEIVIYFMK